MEQGGTPSQPELQALRSELEAARQEVAHLQAALAASERQREEVAGQLAAERAQAAALRAQEGSIASGHQELQEAWKGMVDELRAQLTVRGGCLAQGC
jgi:septal ring factor EnvC (AmiA/AmiB activator)